MKSLGLTLVIFLSGLALCFAAEKNLIIDDFEIAVTGGPEGTVDFGAGNGSSVEVSSAADLQYSDKLSLKIAYDAVAGGYMYIAKGTGLDAKNAAWQVKPEEIKWDEYKAISFYVYGADSKAKIAFDVKDNGGEIWRYIFEDDFKGWKQIVIPFNEFFARGDWQPESADKNAKLDFPLKSYQFEPLPVAKGVLYVDKIELVVK